MRGLLREGGLFIQFVYTGWWWLVAKVFRGFRFDPELYAGFRRLVSGGGCTVTGAFERFMSCCVECGVWFFLIKGQGVLRLRLGFWLIGCVRVSGFTVGLPKDYPKKAMPRHKQTRKTSRMETKRRL